jgi:hypothetical protein
MKMCAAMLAIACFLTFGQGAVSSVLAADPPAPSPADSKEWETWPKKPGGAETAGLAGGEKTSSVFSSGSWGWWAGGAAGVLLIAIAASGGGGGNGNSPPACNQ